MQNAIEASLHQSPAVISITLSQDQSGIYLGIKDNGKGIPEDKLNLIFKPFFTFGKENGTGVGLSQTKDVVMGHDAELQVFSKLGEGSEFRITWKKQINKIRRMQS